MPEAKVHLSSPGTCLIAGPEERLQRTRHRSQGEHDNDVIGCTDWAPVSFNGGLMGLEWWWWRRKSALSL